LHLHGAPAPCGVTAIGHALGLPKSSAHRLLASLARRGLVERDTSGRWQPGFALVALGLGVLEREPLVAAARPALEREAAELGETFFLVAARAGRLFVLDKAEGTGYLRAAPRVGASIPVHATAVGKLYLAFDPGRVEASAPAAGFTPRTLADPAALRAEVELVRTRGWATNRDEWVEGLSVVAAPVRRARAGALDGAVALAAASPRLDAIGVEAAAARVLAVAASAAARLDGRVGRTEGRAA
jgi:DNA-binding IclR family transcriptional regulator